jgi:hypothetical protein
MAVASFRRNGRVEAMRGFHPPKTTTVTHWYRAATAQIDDAPDWRTVDMGAAVVDADTIVFSGFMRQPTVQGQADLPWDLFIARKRNLK